MNKPIKMAKIADVNGKSHGEEISKLTPNLEPMSKCSQTRVEMTLDESGIENNEDSTKIQREKSTKSWPTTLKKIIKQNLFIILLLLGIGTGAALGAGLRHSHSQLASDPLAIMFLSFPGDIFLRMLKACIIPLIVSSLISGMAALPSTAAGRIGGCAMLYYMVTTFVAVILGIILVATIQPGYRGFDSQSVKEQKGQLTEPVDALLDLIR